jgi:cysteine desulfurase/selenocysteine lyase
MTIDLARARRETPGTNTVTHFNNAGAALMPQPVLDAVTGYLQEEALYGGYETANKHSERLEKGVYESVAKLINAHSDEIAFIENATRAWDMAFYAFDFKPGDRIITAKAEYGSNYIAYLQVAKRTGAVIEVVPNDEHGQLDLKALEHMLDERVKLVAITHIPTNGGLVNPVAGVGALTRAAGVPFLLDACQSVGQMPVDVEAIGCDMLSGTSRKFLRGPRGMGFLYVRRPWIEQLEPPLLDNHAATWISRDQIRIRADARRFENWECNLAGKWGMGAAVDYALDWGIDAIWERVQKLSAQLRTGLAALPGLTLRDIGAQQCGIVTFTIDGIEPLEIKQRLAAEQINVSHSMITSTRLDMEDRNLTSVVRASVHYYNSEEEVERLCQALEHIVR